MTISEIKQGAYGLTYWMERAIRQVCRARRQPSPAVVHDLRVALRRCRTILKGLASERRVPVFKKIEKQAKVLFGRLGDLRDVQVWEAWNRYFEDFKLPCHEALTKLLEKAAKTAHKKAGKSIRKFSIRRWKNLKKSVREEISSNPVSEEFLKDFIRAKQKKFFRLHALAEKRGTGKACHRLRIALKKLRYAVENFAPEIYDKHGARLADLQGALGEFHDLCLFEKFLKSQKRLFPRYGLKMWEKILRHERLKRIRRYHRLMKNEKDGFAGRGRQFDIV